MTETLDLRFPDGLAADFPVEFPAAHLAVARVLAGLDGSSYAALEEHSPALKNNDWSNYLRCSMARMVHAAGALRRAGVSQGKLLDYGAYFGNFSGMFADLGFEVDAIDGFRSYAGSLEQPLALMRSRGIAILDFDDVGRDLSGLPEARYDVILCAGVIEHMPHSPLGLLSTLNRVLKPGGQLITDTPNLGDLYKRQALARGESVWPPLAAQFHSPVPYEGHHREYTAAEVAWMLHEVGHQVRSIELYNYSCYQQATLRGRDVTNFWKTVADPTLREYLTALSTRDVATTAAAPAPDWRTLLVEAEPHWQAVRPALPPAGGGDLIDQEPLLVQLQHDVATRDRLLTELSDERTEAVEARDRTIAELNEMTRVRAEHAAAEVAVRDRTIAELNERIGALQRTLDAKLSEVVKRQLHRLTRR